MLVFILKRAVQSVIVMLAVTVIAFSLFRYVGDPVGNLVGQDTSIEQRAELREQLGLNDPYLVQLGRFVGNMAQGEFGNSYRHRRPVVDLVSERLPATLELAIVSAIIAIGVGIPMGVYTAIRRKSWLAQGFMTFSLIGISLPTFLIGILLILWFGVNLRWLPTYGRGDVVDLGWWETGLLTASGLKSIILPAITLALFQMTLLMRLVRAEMLEVMRMDFVRFARARGLAERTINFSIALRNTLVPVITIIGLQLGSIIAFAIITEAVFQWPGMGLLFLQAVSDVDIPIMATYLVLIALIFVVINLIVDLLYAVVDPRLRAERGGI